MDGVDTNAHASAVTVLTGHIANNTQKKPKTELKGSADSMSAPILSTDDFLRGQIDCQDGTPHKAGQSSDYDRGYAAQYQHDENLSELSLMQERMRGRQWN